MKRLLVFVFLMSSLNLLSQEKYVTSLDLTPYGQTGYEVTTYERMGNHFVRTYDGKESYFFIVTENDSYLTLVNSTDSYQSVFVVFFDKINKTFCDHYFNPETMSEQEKRKQIGQYVRIE